MNGTVPTREQVIRQADADYSAEKQASGIRPMVSSRLSWVNKSLVDCDYAPLSAAEGLNLRTD